MEKYTLGPTQDWSHYFKEIFKHQKIQNLLEFGLGVGTEFLLENCSNVTSVELSLGDYNLDWYLRTKKSLSEYKNWESFYIDLPEEIKEADSRAKNLKFPLDDTDYLVVLDNIVNPFMRRKEYDFIFIDAGIHTRGDLVNMSFGNSDIIAAHDTSRDPKRVLENVYGYNIVEVPEDYEEIHFEDTYMGTTIWIKKNMSDLIEILRDYKVEI